MIITRLIFLVCFCSIGLSSLYAQEWHWAHSFGGEGVEHGQKLSTDQEGNLFFIGTFEKDFVLEEDTLVSKGRKDVFITKYNTIGELQWIKTFGGEGLDYCFDLEIDEMGSIYISGAFEKVITIDSLSFEAVDNHDSYFAKFSKDGELLWFKKLGGKGFDAAYGLSYVNKELKIMGVFEDPKKELTNLSTYDNNAMFVGSYSAMGDSLWIKTTQGAGRVFANSMETDAEGNLFLTGEFGGNVSFESDTLDKNYGIFVMKLTALGEVKWMQALGDQSIKGFGADLAVDSQGDVYLTGGFEGIGKLANEVIAIEGEPDAFLLALSGKNGAVKWLRKAGGIKFDKGMGLCSVDTSIYMIGWIEGRAAFGIDTVLTTNGGNNFFIAKYGASGDLLWTEMPLAKGLGYGKDIHYAGNHQFYVTGWYEGILNFPTSLFIMDRKPDVFVGKFEDKPD